MSMRRMQVALCHLKGPGQQRQVEIEIMDDASNQLLALIRLDPAQFTKLMASDVIAVRGTTTPAVHRALNAAMDCP